MRNRIASYAEMNGFGHKLMLAAGLLAACGFAFVSIASNLRFGISLGANPFDRIVYGVLSAAADLMKIALPMVTVVLWRKGERILALASAVFLIGTIAFSICGAIGFAASSRGQALALSEKGVESRKAWEARIIRVEQRLDLIGVRRPANVIQAEIDRLLRTPGADDCKAVNGPITQEICPKVYRLQEELTASNQAARLEADLVADREALSEIPVVTITDPQSAALKRLTGLDEGTIRTAIATMIALLVELGSTLGFTLIILAVRSAETAVHSPEGSAPSLPPLRELICPAPASGSAPSDDDLVTRWALARLDIVSTGMIQAELAYQDFRQWCSAHRHAALTPQMFGRRFTKVHASMGGRKVRRNGRAYYEGASLQENLRADFDIGALA
jgi:hypothetical protein